MLGAVVLRCATGHLLGPGIGNHVHAHGHRTVGEQSKELVRLLQAEQFPKLKHLLRLKEEVLWWAVCR